MATALSRASLKPKTSITSSLDGGHAICAFQTTERHDIYRQFHILAAIAKPMLDARDFRKSAFGDQLLAQFCESLPARYRQRDVDVDVFGFRIGAMP